MFGFRVAQKYIQLRGCRGSEKKPIIADATSSARPLQAIFVCQRCRIKLCIKCDAQMSIFVDNAVRFCVKYKVKMVSFDCGGWKLQKVTNRGYFFFLLSFPR